MASNLTTRIAFAAIAIPVALGVVWYGGLPLALLISLVAWLGTGELLTFSRQQGIRPWAPAALVSAAALPLLAWAAATRPETAATVDAAYPYAAALWVIVVLVATLARLAPTQKPLSAAAITLFAPLYAGALPAFVLTMRHANQGGRSVAGTALVFFPLVTVWVCDSVAMTVGKRVGGPKLWPTVSPNKTWSGSIGGLVGALAMAPIFTSAVFRPAGVEISPWQALAVAGVLGVMGQIGDLAESLLKREVGMKDSSHLIPGHGGVLDRFDSLYFAIPLTAGLYRLFGII
jgi:phosphatidate cytidylyltransferase